jgi:hypothetical protein
LSIDNIRETYFKALKYMDELTSGKFIRQIMPLSELSVSSKNGVEGFDDPEEALRSLTNSNDVYTMMIKRAL